jgi:signal peptidase I
MRMLNQALQVAKVALLVLLTGLLAPLVAGTLPGVLGYESYVLADGDMRPSMQPGDLGVVQPVRASAVHAGDVITFRKPSDPETVLTRRVLSIEPDTTAAGRLNLQTRGDAEPTSESVIVGATVQLGRVAYTLPRMGELLAFVDAGIGRVLLLILPGLLLALDLLRTRRQMSPRTNAQAERIPSLLECGERALEAGYAPLALRAAEGVLALQPANLAARRLRRDALHLFDEGDQHVAA